MKKFNVSFNTVIELTGNERDDDEILEKFEAEVSETLRMLTYESAHDISSYITIEEIK